MKPSDRYYTPNSQYIYTVYMQGFRCGDRSSSFVEFFLTRLFLWLFIVLVVCAPSLTSTLATTRGGEGRPFPVCIRPHIHTQGERTRMDPPGTVAVVKDVIESTPRKKKTKSSKKKKKEVVVVDDHHHHENKPSNVSSEKTEKSSKKKSSNTKKIKKKTTSGKDKTSTHSTNSTSLKNNSNHSDHKKRSSASGNNNKKKGGKKKSRLSSERRKAIKNLENILAPSEDEGSCSDDDEPTRFIDRGKYRSILDSILAEHGGATVSNLPFSNVDGATGAGVTGGGGGDQIDRSEYDSDSSYGTQTSAEDHDESEAESEAESEVESEAESEAESVDRMHLDQNSKDNSGGEPQQQQRHKQQRQQHKHRSKEVATSSALSSSHRTTTTSTIPATTTTTTTRTTREINPNPPPRHRPPPRPLLMHIGASGSLQRIGKSEIDDNDSLVFEPSVGSLDDSQSRGRSTVPLPVQPPTQSKNTRHRSRPRTTKLAIPTSPPSSTTTTTTTVNPPPLVEQSSSLSRSDRQEQRPQQERPPPRQQQRQEQPKDRVRKEALRSNPTPSSTGSDGGNNGNTTRSVDSHNRPAPSSLPMDGSLKEEKTSTAPVVVVQDKQETTQEVMEMFLSTSRRDDKDNEESCFVSNTLFQSKTVAMIASQHKNEKFASLPAPLDNNNNSVPMVEVLTPSPVDVVVNDPSNHNGSKNIHKNNNNDTSSSGKPVLADSRVLQGVETVATNERSHHDDDDGPEGNAVFMGQTSPSDDRNPVPSLAVDATQGELEIIKDEQVQETIPLPKQHEDRCNDATRSTTKMIPTTTTTTPQNTTEKNPEPQKDDEVLCKPALLVELNKSNSSSAARVEESSAPATEIVEAPATEIVIPVRNQTEHKTKSDYGVIGTVISVELKNSTSNTTGTVHNAPPVPLVTVRDEKQEESMNDAPSVVSTTTTSIINMGHASIPLKHTQDDEQYVHEEVVVNEGVGSNDSEPKQNTLFLEEEESQGAVVVFAGPIVEEKKEISHGVREESQKESPQVLKKRLSPPNTPVKVTGIGNDTKPKEETLSMLESPSCTVAATGPPGLGVNHVRTTSLQPAKKNELTAEIQTTTYSEHQGISSLEEEENERSAPAAMESREIQTTTSEYHQGIASLEEKDETSAPAAMESRDIQITSEYHQVVSSQEEEHETNARSIETTDIQTTSDHHDVSSQEEHETSAPAPLENIAPSTTTELVNTDMVLVSDHCRIEQGGAQEEKHSLDDGAGAIENKDDVPPTATVISTGNPWAPQQNLAPEEAKTRLCDLSPSSNYSELDQEGWLFGNGVIRERKEADNEVEAVDCTRNYPLLSPSSEHSKSESSTKSKRGKGVKPWLFGAGDVPSSEDGSVQPPLPKALEVAPYSSPPPPPPALASDRVFDDSWLGTGNIVESTAGIGGTENEQAADTVPAGPVPGSITRFVEGLEGEGAGIEYSVFATSEQVPQVEEAFLVNNDKKNNRKGKKRRWFGLRRRRLSKQ